MNSLPNGKTTTSVTSYLRAWRKVARPIEKMFNVKLSAFDPNLTFTRTVKMQEGYFHQTVQLPLWFVLSLNNTDNSKRKKRHKAKT